MFSARLAGLLVITAAFFTSAVVGPAPASGEDRIDVRVEVFGFAGLHVLTNQTSTSENANGYSIAMNLDTRGLASAFVDLQSRSEVQGALTGEVLRPAAYRADVKRNGFDRHYGVKYLGDGTVVDNSGPKSADGAHIDAGQVRGTVDQLTAYFLLERQLAKRGSCQLVVSVFDGSELYKLHFADLGQDTLSADNHQAFAGATKVCDISREVIVASNDKLEGTYQHGKIWYASLLPHRQMVPVRIQYDTVFGAVTGYLAELTGEGVHLHLAGE
jgi:hypothetical protein